VSVDSARCVRTCTYCPPLREWRAKTACSE
jgi:hypothetical protein